MTARYLLALGFIALVSVGSFWVLQTSIRTERASASLINVGGRQRMLSQRVAQYALRLALAPPGVPAEEARAELESAVTLMTSSHQLLLQGALPTGLAKAPSAEVTDLYVREAAGVNAQVTAYLARARQLLNTPQLEPTHPDLVALLSSSDPLLHALDTVVTQYEHEAELDNAALSTLATAGLLATLLTSALIGLFMFRPMIAAAKRSVAERTRLLHAAEAALRRSEVLYKVADTVSRATSVKSVLKDIVAETALALGADRVLLVTVDVAARTVNEVEIGGPSADQVPPVTFEELWEGLSGWVLRNGETACSPAGERDPRESEQTAETRAESGSAQVLVAPLQVQETRFGTLTVIRDSGAAAFSADETALLTAVASQAAVALSSALAAAARDRFAGEFEAIFNAMPDAVLFADAERQIRLVNPATERVFGYTQAALLGKKSNLLYAETSDYQKQGVQRYHSAATGVGSYEMRYRRENGDEFWGETVGTVVRDRSGTVLGYMGIIRDITEVRAQERERLAEQAFLAAVLESIDDGIVACDASGNLTLFNRSSRELHGLREDAALDPSSWADHYDLYRQDGVTPLTEAEIPLVRAFRNDEVVDAEMVVAPKGSPRRVLKAQGRALYDADGAKLGAVVAMHDLSEQRRVEAENRQWLEHVQLLYDVSTQNDLNPDEQLDSALALSARLLGLDYGILSRVEGERYTITHLHDQTGTLRVGAVYQRKVTYCSLTIQRDDVLAIHHMAADERRGHPCYDQFGLEAYIGIPIKVAGELWGVLSFSSVLPRSAFSDVDLELLRLLGQFVSTTLERQANSLALQRYADELQTSNRALAQRNRDIGLLSSMSELLQAAADFSEAFSVIEHYAKALFAPLQGGLLWADGGETLTGALTWGGARNVDAEWKDCWALRLGRSHRASTNGGGPSCAHSEPGSSHFCVPLIAHNETLGVLYLQTSPSTAPTDVSATERPTAAQRTDRLSAGAVLADARLADARPTDPVPSNLVPSNLVPADLKATGTALDDTAEAYKAPAADGLSPEVEALALAFGEGLAVTLANLQLRESLKQQSIRDPLTNLFNRRYLEETLERELFRSVRAGRPLSFVMFDIDHFKTFNDTFGHEAGDLVLRHVARLADTMVRKEDIACRYGGEEFALILPDATASVALARAEKLRLATRDLQLTFKGRSLGQITLSLGVVTVTRGSDLGKVVSLGDAALYAAKRGGRDRVEVASVPFDESPSPVAPI